MKPSQIETRCCICSVLLLSLITVGLTRSAEAQQDSSRKLIQRIAAPYPPLARSMALKGTVRVEAVVAPDGSVRTVETKGGHPVLVQAAVNAIRRWKWEPAAKEPREVVEVKFFGRITNVTVALN